MKEKIHPRFYEDARVVCACGNTFTTGSTRKELRVEICGKCHPFYTGEKRMMDAAGRVERFRRRYASSAEAIAARNARQAAKKEKEAAAAAEAAPAPAPVARPPARKERRARAAAQKAAETAPEAPAETAS